jgi:dihydroxyacetone synthase
LPGKKAYEHFGFDAKAIAPKVKALVEEVKKEGVDSLRGDFRDLNGTMGYGFEH